MEFWGFGGCGYERYDVIGIFTPYVGLISINRPERYGQDGEAGGL